MRSIIVTVLVYALATPALAGALRADVDCRPAADAGLVFDCTIRLADAQTREPVSDAEFTVGADMPSMPMAHNVRPVKAVPGDTPGVYRARLELEMYGTWMLKLRLSDPVQDQIHTKVEFVDTSG